MFGIKTSFQEVLMFIFWAFRKILSNLLQGLSFLPFLLCGKVFGNALVEAMACGVPVVSSDCRSGPREILAPDTDFSYQTQKPEFAEYGVLMPVFEVKYKSAEEPLGEKEMMWVETIDKLLEDESLRRNYSEKAKQRAEDFRIEKIVQEWKEVLK
jgi:glycosyltransferase involved in cell wall biosynthesis